MKSDAFPSAHRASLACPLLRLLLLVAGSLALMAGRAGAVELDALVGFGQSTTAGARYRPDTWTPLTVYITGQGVHGVGQLQVSVRQGERKSIYTRRVPLREGALNEAESFAINLYPVNPYGGFQNTGPEIAVQLLVDGRKLAEKKIALSVGTNPETYNVLALPRDGSGMNFLTKKKLGLIHRHYDPAVLMNMRGMGGTPNQSGRGIDPNASLQVLYTDPRALPAMVQGYAMMDAIALADQPLDSLTEDQTEALKQYVRDGGLLLLSGGGDLARLKGQFYAEMLPVTPTGAASAGALPELEGRYQERLGIPEPVALLRGTLKPGARTLFGTLPGSTGYGLVAARPYGCGTVVVTAFDYLAPEFRGWKAAPALWRDLLRSGNEAVSARDLLWNNTRNVDMNGLRLADALAGRQATSAPAFSTVAIFLGAYIFLLVPFSYFVLKKMDKREFAWITAPILIAGFTVVSYLIALSIKGGALTLNRAVVLETQANSDQVAGYGQMTLYSPRRAGYDIGFGDPDDPNNPYRSLAPGEVYTPLYQDIARELMIEHDKTTTIRGAEVKLWDKRSFDVPVAVSPGGPIEAKTAWISELDGGSADLSERIANVRVTVTNKTRFALKDCALVSSAQQVPLGDMAPGETKSAPLRWVSRGGAFGLGLPSRSGPPVVYDGPHKTPITPEMTRNAIRDALAETLRQNSQRNMGWPNDISSGYGKAANVFIGWSYDPVLDVRVDGRLAAGEEANLLVTHLPPPANAPSRSAANPFAQTPILTLEDELPAGARKIGIFK
jgi:hypothetical protein